LKINKKRLDKVKKLWYIVSCKDENNATVDKKDENLDDGNQLTEKEL